MNDGSPDGRVGFAVDGATLTVRDLIEGKALRIGVDREPTLSPALPDLFPLPVDRAVSFDAGLLAVSEYTSINVRTAEGDFLAKVDDPADFPRGDYCVEINGAAKALVRVTDAEISATGAAGPEPVELAFDRETTVTVGGRSLHTRPEATVTVPDDPAGLAEAVSVLGSSIREFSPERSWPTLRGYPPRFERGDALEIPSPLRTPDTGVEVVARPTHADVYRLSTLSSYLGARMRIGKAPSIRLANGYVERLPLEGTALEERVTDLLRTWFFLDTLARTEGYVPSDRYEYDQVAGELPFYPPKLADRSLSERLMEYLEVDPETVAPYAPAWPTAAVLRPAPAAAELLPHLAHVLAPIRVRGAADPPRPDAPAALATSPQATGAPSTVGGGSVPNPDADDLPPWTSVLTPTAYENLLAREVTARGDVSVAVLLDDADRARSVRDSLTTPTDVDGVGSWSLHADPDPETVSEVLTDSTLDVAYCGLPVRDGRVETAAGPVAVSARSTDGEAAAPALSVFERSGSVAVATDAVDRGSAAAVAVADAADPNRIRAFIGLVAAGCPVTAAARLALTDAETDARFAGDPATSVATDRGLPTNLIECRPADEDSFDVRFRSLSSTEVSLGQEVTLVADPLDSATALVGAPERHVGRVGASNVLALHEEDGPIIRLGDEFVFSDDPLSSEDLRAFAREGDATDGSPAGDGESGSECRRGD